jgi:hypothetical protein
MRRDAPLHLFVLISASFWTILTGTSVLAVPPSEPIPTPTGLTPSPNPPDPLDSSDKKDESDEKKSDKNLKKTNWTAWILRDTRLKQRLTDLVFPTRELPVMLIPKEGKLRPLVNLRGYYNRPGWSLFTQDTLLLNSQQDRTQFGFFAYIKSRINEVLLTARGPNGEIETEKIIISAPEAQEFRINSQWGEIMASLGISYLSYFQTGFGNFNSWAIILSGDYFTPKWNSRFGLTAGLNMTVFTFASEPAHNYPQILEGRIDGTYVLPSSPQYALQTTLVAGAGYLSMISNGSPFGFANLIVPEIGAQVSLPLSLRYDLVGQFRYIPIAGFSPSALVTQRGLETSLGGTLLLKNLHKIKVDLTISDYRYQPDNSTDLKTTLIYLRCGYGL